MTLCILSYRRVAGPVLFFCSLGNNGGNRMGADQREAKRPAELSFMVVLHGAKCAPLLVRRGSFISKVGSATARRTYQIPYLPSEFPSATRVVSEDPF